MPPEVAALAWALLFVIASGLVFRFFSWLGRRARARRSSNADALTKAEETVAPKAAAAPLSVAATAPAPAPPAANVPKPAPARDYVSPRSSAEAATPNVSRAVAAAYRQIAETAEAPKPSARTALKPSIGATLAPTPPPTVLQKPNIAATLPPQPIIPIAPNPEPIAFGPAPSDPGPAPAVPMPLTPSEFSEDPAPEPETAAAPLVARTAATKSVALRARRLGEVAPRLDIRLKESRSRKVITVPKASRKPAEKAVTKEMKVLVPRSVPGKTPVRRIVRKVDAETILASAQAQTRVVGVPQRRFRILSATEL
ncbi:hypothetical protein [Hyphomicrobium sp.]|uniref:hypothetical protein n=1 Tax=Hyphomicrobium sp. TaxID=82 RepID=UPI000F9A7FA4|nr:hypothetical protein [Hyphomicrobium sp.]RUP10182.1 MAG: hypothetical protein EKK38_07055 [Hyphomicrobium sp.]